MQKSITNQNKLIQIESKKILSYFQNMYNDYVTFFETQNVTVDFKIIFSRKEKRNLKNNQSSKTIPIILHISMYPDGFSRYRAQGEYVYQSFYSCVGMITKGKNTFTLDVNKKPDKAAIYFFERLIKRLNKKRAPEALKERFRDVLVNTFYVKRRYSSFAKTYQGGPWYIIWFFLILALVILIRIIIPTSYRYYIYTM